MEKPEPSLRWSKLVTNSESSTSTTFSTPFGPLLNANARIILEMWNSAPSATSAKPDQKER